MRRQHVRIQLHMLLDHARRRETRRSRFARMRAEPRLMAMPLLRRGQRLSVQPVTPHE